MMLKQQQKQKQNLWMKQAKREAKVVESWKAKSHFCRHEG